MRYLLIFCVIFTTYWIVVAHVKRYRAFIRRTRKSQIALMSHTREKFNTTNHMFFGFFHEMTKFNDIIIDDKVIILSMKFPSSSFHVSRLRTILTSLQLQDCKNHTVERWRWRRRNLSFWIYDVSVLRIVKLGLFRTQNIDWFEIVQISGFLIVDWWWFFRIQELSDN